MSAAHTGDSPHSSDIQAAEALLADAGRLREEGRDAAAEPLYVRAISLLETAIGPAHIKAAEACLLLADLKRFLNLDEEAIPLLQRSLGILEGALGPDHLQVAEVLLRLGDVHLDQPDDDHFSQSRAEWYYRRAADILEKQLGAGHPLADARPDLLAELHNLRGHYAEAESLHQWALTILREEARTDPLRVSAQMVRWARFCSQRGRFEESVRVLRQALEIAEDVLGPEHPSLRPYLHRLADYCLVWDPREMFDAASTPTPPRMDLAREKETLYLRALAIDEKHFGKDHPAVVKDLTALEAHYAALDRAAESTTIRRRILAIVDRVGTSRRSWAVEILLRIRERSPGELAADATELLHQALALAEGGDGEDDRRYIESMFRFARLCLSEGRIPEADTLFGRLRAVTARAHGTHHPRMALLLLRIAVAYCGRRHAQATRYFDEALRILRTATGIDDARVAEELHMWADAYEMAARIPDTFPAAIESMLAGLPRPVEVERPPGPDVEGLHRIFLAAFEKGLGPDHPVVGQSLLRLASDRLREGNETEAERLFLRVRAIGQTAGAQGRNLEVASASGLAMLYHIQVRFTEAEPLYRRWLAGWEQDPNLAEIHLVRPLFNLARCCLARGRRDEADALARWALRILQDRQASFGFSPDREDFIRFYRLLGREADVERVIRHELSAAEGVWGRDHPQVERHVTDLAETRYRQGDFAEAEQLYRRAIASCEASLGPDGGTRLAPLLTGLGQLYAGQGMSGDAQPLFERAIAILEGVCRRNAKEDGWLVKALDEYASLLRGTHRETEAHTVELRAAPLKTAVEADRTRRLRDAVRHGLFLDWDLLP